MTGAEQIRVRISKKGIRASDIKHRGLLTEDEIAFIPIEKVYEWIKTGQWNLKDYKVWLKTIRVIE